MLSHLTANVSAAAKSIIGDKRARKGYGRNTKPLGADQRGVDVRGAQHGLGLVLSQLNVIASLAAKSIADKQTRKGHGGNKGLRGCVDVRDARTGWG